jgi:DNA modification methylase
MILPLLEVLDEQGGSATIGDIYNAVATKISVADEIRDNRQPVGARGQNINTFERNVRWSQQRARLLGLTQRVERGHWQITGKGRAALHAAIPGVVITVYETENGVALFGRAEDAIGYIDDGSIQLILTSPPYPLLRKKEYGNVSADEYIEWFLHIARDWPRKMTPDGSLVLNLADVWNPGVPTMSLYQERLILRLAEDLGFRLAQRFAWLNPSKMPTPAEWVTVRRVRVKPSIEQIWWLSQSDHPFADNRAILRPYSDSMMYRIRQGGERGAERPSGHNLKPGAFATDNGGSIPDNLLVAANTDSNTTYQRYCRERGVKVHPARFPGQLPNTMIRLLTRENDTVYDPFGGSLTTAEEAERLNRRWITSEMHLDYLVGGVGGRFGKDIHTSGMAN